MAVFKLHNLQTVSWQQNAIFTDKDTNVVFLLSVGVMNTCISKTYNIGKSLEYLLATGNLVSKTGLGLMQVWCNCYIDYNKNKQNIANAKYSLTNDIIVF